MKQKYSLMIADMQLSVITDAEPEQVEKIVGILDRKMREINLKSRRCSKNEAALLCALDFCADKMTLQEENAELSERCEKYATVLDAFKEQVADLREQLDNMKNENEVLRSVISRGEGFGMQEKKEEEVIPPSPSELLAQIADASGIIGASDMPEAEPEAPAEAQTEGEGRSRVGSMFDLISFNDI